MQIVNWWTATYYGLWVGGKSLSQNVARPNKRKEVASNEYSGNVDIEREISMTCYRYQMAHITNIK